MSARDIILAIDAEISRLEQARELLVGVVQTGVKRRGRPKGSASRATSFNPADFVPRKRRSMSPEGKARIAAAQRARWAKQKASERTKAKKATKSAAGKQRVASLAGKESGASRRTSPSTSSKALPNGGQRKNSSARGPLGGRRTQNSADQGASAKVSSESVSTE